MAGAAGRPLALADLPHDVLERCLQLVGLDDAWRARAACRGLRAAVESGALRGALRAAADDASALERLAAAARGGRLRPDALAVTLQRGRRRATRGRREALLLAAAAAAAACGAELYLSIEAGALDLRLLDSFLAARSPGLARLAALALPDDLPLHADTAAALAAAAPRLRRLSAPVPWRGYAYMDPVLAPLGPLPLEELRLRPAGALTSVQGRALALLASAPAGRSLRLLDLGPEVFLEGPAARALFALPRLETLVSPLYLADAEGEAALVEAVACRPALRELSLGLHARSGPVFASRLATALAASSITALDLYARLYGGDVSELLEAAGGTLRACVLRTRAPSVRAARALAACGPQLQQATFWCPLASLSPEIAGALAPLAARGLPGGFHVGLGACSAPPAPGAEAAALAAALAALPHATLETAPPPYGLSLSYGSS